MHIELAFLGALGMCAVAVGCGAKVTVDVGTQGAGGVGGTTSTSTTTPSSTAGTPTGPSGTTGGGIVCGGMSCSGSSDGSCDCQGVCTVQQNQQKLEVQCAPVPGGGETCTCIENGIKIANCQQNGTPTCDFQAGCCAAQFFGFGSSGAG